MLEIILLVTAIIGNIFGLIGIYWAIKAIEKVEEKANQLEMAVKGLRNEVVGKGQENARDH